MTWQFSMTFVQKLKTAAV